MIYEYARASTQSVDAQVKQLRAAGAEKVFHETAGGAKIGASWRAPAGDYYVILHANAPGEAMIRAHAEPDAFPLPPIVLVE